MQIQSLTRRPTKKSCLKTQRKSAICCGALHVASFDIFLGRGGGGGGIQPQKPVSHRTLTFGGCVDQRREPQKSLKKSTQEACQFGLIQRERVSAHFTLFPRIFPNTFFFSIPLLPNFNHMYLTDGRCSMVF